MIVNAGGTTHRGDPARVCFCIGNGQDRCKTKAGARITPPAQGFTTNQLGPETVAMGKTEELCIPSVSQ